MKRKKHQSDKRFKLIFTVWRSQRVQASPAFLRLSRGCDGRLSSSHNTPSSVCSPVVPGQEGTCQVLRVFGNTCVSVRLSVPRVLWLFFLSLFSIRLTSLPIVNVFSLHRSLPFSLAPSLPHTSLLCQKSSSVFGLLPFLLPLHRTAVRPEGRRQSRAATRGKR